MITPDRPRRRLGAPIRVRCGPAEPPSCNSHAHRLVTVTPSDIADLERVWVASQDIDGAAFRPATGWWSLADWADAALLLRDGETTVGAVAVRRDSGTERAEARLALLPSGRHAIAAGRLLEGARALARDLGASTLRLHLPARAAWARRAAARRGFVRVRTRALMLRPAASPPVAPRRVPGATIRPLRQAEEAALIAALNRAWAGTWGFRPITAHALAADLRGQKQGFLVAVEAAGERIVGTVHAVYDPAARTPDGGPYAWLSNLTVAPEWRGRGLGRALLGAALEHLRGRGARSVVLGVDADDPAPVALYRSAGFEVIDGLEVWEGCGTSVGALAVEPAAAATNTEDSASPAHDAGDQRLHDTRKERDL